jgi:hypothetical protein
MTYGCQILSLGNVRSMLIRNFSSCARPDRGELPSYLLVVRERCGNRKGRALAHSNWQLSLEQIIQIGIRQVAPVYFFEGAVLLQAAQG